MDAKTHQQFSQQYNKEWGEFIEKMNKMNLTDAQKRQKVFEFGKEMSEKHKFKSNY